MQCWALIFQDWWFFYNSTQWPCVWREVVCVKARVSVGWRFFWKERPALVVFESRLIKALSPYKITTAINRTSKKKKKCLSVFLMFHLAAFFLSVLNSHRSLQKMTSYSSKVQKLSAVRQVSFLVILKSLVIWKWRSDLEGYTVLHNMFLISSSYTLSACERRSGGGVGVGGQILKQRHAQRSIWRKAHILSLTQIHFQGDTQPVPAAREWRVLFLTANEFITFHLRTHWFLMSLQNGIQCSMVFYETPQHLCIVSTGL